MHAITCVNALQGHHDDGHHARACLKSKVWLMEDLFLSYYISFRITNVYDY